MKRLEIAQHPELFGNRIEVVITFDGEEKGRMHSPAGDVADAINQQLCHLVKHTVGELVKAVTLASFAKHQAAGRLRAALDGLRTNGDLVVLAGFIDKNRNDIEAVCPPFNHRLHRACQQKIDFVFEVGELSRASKGAWVL